MVNKQVEGGEGMDIDCKYDGCGCVSVIVSVTVAIVMIRLLIGVLTY